MRYVLEYMLKEASEPLEAPAAQKSAAPHNKCFSRFQLGMSQSGFGNAPAKSQNALVPRGSINLITNNFKIKSQNHGIIYTYSVDFIDGE